MIDAPGDYNAVYVTVQEISVHQASGEVDVEDPGWIPVLDFSSTDGERINLLEWQDPENPFDLGVAELEAGDYTQLRLKLMNNDDQPAGAEHPYNYVVDSEGNEIPLKVPSGSQTGIKIVKGFTIEAQGATALLLDFDAEKSVVQAGKSGNWLLKPTIKVVDTVTNYIVGNITPAEANVNAQQIALTPLIVNDLYDENGVSVYDANGVSVDQVVVVNGAEPYNGTGDYDYQIPVAPDIYNVVATMMAYYPDCQVVDATPGYSEHDANAVDLAPATDQGTLTAFVSGLAGDDDSATFSIRQNNGVCGTFEVASVNVKNNDNSDPITLPVGTYQVLVTSGELAPMLFEDFNIGAGDEIEVDAAF